MRQLNTQISSIISMIAGAGNVPLFIANAISLIERPPPVIYPRRQHIAA